MTHAMTREAALLAGFALAVLLLGFAPGGAARAAMSKDEIKTEVEKSYGVVVLRMKEVEAAGRPALAVTVMNKGGNDSRAFQVNTLLIDPESGHLMPAYRVLPDGYRFSEILPSDPNKQPSDLLAARDARPWR